MYKNKYLKYKQKYLELKKTTNYQVKQLGGCTLFPILTQFDQDRFIEWYNMKTGEMPDGENKNSFEIYLDLLNLFDLIFPAHQDSIEPYNVLVGAGCTNDPDYFRFKDSPTYSLYIDLFREKEDPVKQYHMYTINYENLQGNFLRLKQNSVQQIHFDTGVSYFAPIDYLALAEHILTPGGKIIWDLLQHSAQIIFRRRNKFQKTDGTDYSEEEIKKKVDLEKVSINTEEKKITPLNNEFFDTNTICPQIGLNIVEFGGRHYVEKYKLEPYVGFIEYCSKRFSRLYFEKKIYTFANYTYPVPIRTIQYEDGNLKIAVYNQMVNFVVNDVMNMEERNNYINTKRVSIEKIIQLSDRIKRTVDLKNKILGKNLIPKEILDICKTSDDPVEYNLNKIIQEFIWNEFNFEVEYMEATKI
jgi:hypothetical protein